MAASLSVFLLLAIDGVLSSYHSFTCTRVEVHQSHSQVKEDTGYTPELLDFIYTKYKHEGIFRFAPDLMRRTATFDDDYVSTECEWDCHTNRISIA